MQIDQLPECNRNELGKVEEELYKRWKKGDPTLLRVQPEHHDSRLEGVILSILDNNGTYKKGDKVVIHSTPYAVDFATETAFVLIEKGIDPIIIYSLLSNPPLINKLLSVIPTQKAMKKITHIYEELVNYAQHWIVPYATMKDEPNEVEKRAIKTFKDAANKGLSELGKKRSAGELKSHEVISCPVEHEGQKLGLSLPEWQIKLYSAMSITKNKLEKIIEDSGYVNILGEAYRGKTLKIERGGNYPINLTMNIAGRPVIKSIGTVGENSIYGKHFSRVTNLPPGEIFMSPIEDSVKGEIYSKMPLVTDRGTIEDIHLVFKDGRVVKAEATRGLDALEYYTGLANPYTENEKQVYAVQNTVAELGIGINPVLNFENTTGNGLIDEKMRGIHIATGQNEVFGGKNPGSVGGIYVEHKDFILGQVDGIYVMD